MEAKIHTKLNTIFQRNKKCTIENIQKRTNIFFYYSLNSEKLEKSTLFYIKTNEHKQFNAVHQLVCFHI